MTLIILLGFKTYTVEACYNQIEKYDKLFPLI